jgi:hypothetical protein
MHGNKVLEFVLLATTLSLMMVNPAWAQSAPNPPNLPYSPSTPQFSLKLVENSYDVPPTTTSSIDPYNGNTSTTIIPGYHVKNVDIELTITNQPFPSTLNGNASQLYYDVRTKGHFIEDWNDLYPYTDSSSGSLQPQSSSDYTVLSFSANYRAGDEVDFQVQAVLGYQYSYDNYFYNQQPHMIPIHVDSFIYKSSNWSPTQTFTMPETSTSPTPSANPTPTLATTPTQSPSPSITPSPSIPEFPSLIILPLITIMTLIAAIIVRRKKLRKYASSKISAKTKFLN